MYPEPVWFASIVTATVNGTTYLYGIGGRETYFNRITSGVYRSVVVNGVPGPWTKVNQGQLPEARWQGEAQIITINSNTYIYYFGGRGPSGYVSTVYRAPIDNAGNIGTWSSSGQTALPAALVTTTSIFSKTIDGSTYVYLVGGRNSSAVPQSAVYRSTVDSSGNIGSWSTSGQGQLPQATVFGGLTDLTISGTHHVYLVGGTANNSSAKTTVYKSTIDGSTGNIGAWTTTGQEQLPSARMFMYAHAVSDGTNNAIYLFGGENGNPPSARYSTVQKASLDSSGNVGSWTTTEQAQLDAGTSAYASTKVSYGSTTFVYGVGGIGTTNVNFAVSSNGIFSARVENGNVRSISSVGYAATDEGFASPQRLTYVNGKFIISDFETHRIGIYNGLPTRPGAKALAFIGQSSHTSVDINQGGSASARTLYTPDGVASYRGRLLVADASNNRVLIYNSVPTTNNAAADVVVGQPDFTTTSSGTTATKLKNPRNVYVDQQTGKLFIADSNNNRVLIYNSIPTTNGAAADVVIGQTSMTGGSSATSQNRFSYPNDIEIIDGKLFILDSSNNRILIFNAVPTANGASADAVIGQSNFTSGSSNRGGSAAANGLNSPTDMVWNGKKFFVSEYNNNRVLVFDGPPSATNTAARWVLGQPSFTADSREEGSTDVSRMLRNPIGLFAIKDTLYVADSSNFRVVIYDSFISAPNLSSVGAFAGGENGKTRYRGNSVVENPYYVQKVEFSINGGGWNAATPTDGTFDGAVEDFFFDFSPSDNRPRDLQGNMTEGYTLRIRSMNSNLDYTNNVFYFEPFALVSPTDKARVLEQSPLFEFAVNKQRELLSANIQKYQIWTKKGGVSSNTSWSLHIDSIDVSKNNGTYENDSLYARYAEDSSRIAVSSRKNTLTRGTYAWKVVAVDKSGRSIETGSRTVQITGGGSGSVSSDIPVSILNITGVGNPNISSLAADQIKPLYYTWSAEPIFYGIANAGSRVTIAATDPSCKPDTSTCSRSFTTTANPDSRFGINVPSNALDYGKRYTIQLTAEHNDLYTELPPFTLAIGTTNDTTSTSEIQGATASITPSQSPQHQDPKQSKAQKSAPQEQKSCFLFFCW